MIKMTVICKHITVTPVPNGAKCTVSVPAKLRQRASTVILNSVQSGISQTNGYVLFVKMTTDLDKTYDTDIVLSPIHGIGSLITSTVPFRGFNSIFDMKIGQLSANRDSFNVTLEFQTIALSATGMLKTLTCIFTILDND